MQGPDSGTSLPVFSPLGERAVGVEPYGVAPTVAAGVGSPYGAFIDLDTEARASRSASHSVNEVERGRIQQVVEQVIGLVVVNAAALFLYEEVGDAEGDLQAGSKRQRAERTMRRQSYVPGLRHGRDATNL